MIAEPGRNCWRRERATRAAVLVDGEAYFPALHAALARAQRSVLVLSWDIHSQLDLVRGGPSDDLPDTLGERLFALVEERRELAVHILNWDFAMILWHERESSPIFRKAEWRRHPRLHYRLDARHPVGASHHQKVVVIDDRVAFAGGMDLSQFRWDTRRHLADEPRRVDPSGEPYPPYHDVQMAVEGDAAAALGELARERWRRAAGETLEPPGRLDGESPWPDALAADFTDVEVAVARTEPAFEGRPAVREAEALTLDALRAARRSIYLESQYFTSHAVTTALVERLAEDDPPEVVLVLPYRRTGWLEEYTLGVLRSRSLRRLRAADRHGRARVYYPHVPGLDEQLMNVHSKVVLCDDRFLRVGSSNLCNRSMGLDSECDLAIEADGDGPTRDGIRAVLVRLLADQLGAPGERVAAELERGDGLIDVVERLRTDGGRCLAPLDGLIDESLDQALPASAWLDPERPAAVERILDEILAEEAEGPPVSRRVLVAVGAVAALALLALAWRFGPLAGLLDLERVAGWLDRGAALGWAGAAGFAGFVVAAVLAVPVSFLVAATALAFSAPAAFVIAWTASVASAWASYELGAALGRDVVRRLAGPTLNRLSRKLVERGLVTVTALRVVPVAPFVVVNLVMGAAAVTRRDFLLGTALGMAPGVLAISLFVDRLVHAWRSGDPLAYVVAAGVGLALAGGIVLVRRYLARPERGST